MYEARDMALLVRMANFAIANSGRTVDWIHMAGPRYLRSEDERFFSPLADLKAPEARVYLGIVLPRMGCWAWSGGTRPHPGILRTLASLCTAGLVASHQESPAHGGADCSERKIVVSGTRDRSAIIQMSSDVLRCLPLAGRRDHRGAPYGPDARGDIFAASVFPVSSCSPASIHSPGPMCATRFRQS